MFNVVKFICVRSDHVAADTLFSHSKFLLPLAFRFFVAQRHFIFYSGYQDEQEYLVDIKVITNKLG